MRRVRIHARPRSHEAKVADLRSEVIVDAMLRHMVR
jgi:hypothetical protein